MTTSPQTQTSPFFINSSRGHKTKGNQYKERYVEKECPECGYERAYRDEWTQTISYKCMRRSCRHNWFEAKVFEKKVQEN